MDRAVTYHGADFLGVPSTAFYADGTFHAVDLDTWEPDFNFDVALCFETLEHLRDPARWAAICRRASRLVIVSVPTVPTKHTNSFHLHDFTVEQVLNLLGPAADIDVIAQPHEFSHIFVVTLN
jgi:2-polyprenyl-3-methyl-5-hydroxy-6-metoxy-1,4-benzoquinol methylase